jgi:hypothetical protein
VREQNQKQKENIVKIQLNTSAHRASLIAYSLIDFGSREAIELLISYYKFDRQAALDGWNKAFKDYKSFLKQTD